MPDRKTRVLLVEDNPGLAGYPGRYPPGQRHGLLILRSTAPAAFAMIADGRYDVAVVGHGSSRAQRR